MERVIEVESLRMAYPAGKAEVHALRGVDLTVERGCIAGLLGPNGAGKTTLMRILTTLLRPTGGRAMVAGFDTVAQPVQVRRRLGCVAQGNGTDPMLTGLDELHFQARAYGYSRVEARRRAADLVRRFALEAVADRRTATWSGGQRRRLNLALAFVHQPALVVLDEPTTGLNPQSRANLWDEIRRLRDAGATILLTTHYLEEADKLCDRLTIVDHGRVVAEGSPDALKRTISGDIVTVRVDGNPARAVRALAGEEFVRSVGAEDGEVRLVVEHGEPALPAILRLLDCAGTPPLAISLARPTLDDVFLARTGRSLRDEPAAPAA